MRKFHRNMVEHFKDIILHYYKDKNQLGLSAKKLIEAKEIDILKLFNIQQRYEKLSIGSEITFVDNVPTIIVKKENFQTWSTSERQNQRIVLGNQMIKSIKDLTTSLNIKVYPFDIQRATSGFIQFDHIGNEYQLNKEIIFA